MPKTILRAKASAPRPVAAPGEAATEPTAIPENVRRAWRVSLVVSLAAYAVIQTMWITVTPIKRQSVGGSQPNGNNSRILVGTGPDEPQHYLYILSIEHTGRIPRPLPSLRKSAAEYVSHEAQHPPLFYVVAAGIRALVRSFGNRVVWYALRGFGALCGAIALWLISRAAIIAFPDRPFIGIAMAPFLAMLPMFDYMTSELSNFPLELVLTSCGWLLAIEILRRRRAFDLRNCIWLAVWFGLAMLTRQTSAMCLPAVAVILWYALRRTAFEQRPVVARALTAAAAVYAAFAAPWFIYTKLSYGAFMFRSDYRPMLANVSIGDYLANSGQPLLVPNMPHPVHCSVLTTLLWYATTWWIPFWIMQFTVPASFGTVERFQSLFVLADAIAVLALIRHWSECRTKDIRSDPADRVLLWACGLSVAMSVLLVLQQQVYIDIEMFIYSGRYFLSVLAPGSLVLLFSLSTLVRPSLRAAVICAAALGLAMAGFDAWSYHLMHEFYASTGLV